MTLALTLLLLIELGVMMSRTKREYAQFRALTTTEQRQARYGRWVVRSLLLYTGVPLVMLALVHAPSAPLHYPSALTIALTPMGKTIIGGTGGGLIGGMLLGALLSLRAKGAPPMLGNIADLLPRNGAERRYGALLSLSAGLGEELLFRLTLPLLLTSLGVPALFAFAISAVLFGVAHLYQGVAGIIGTMLLGTLLTAIYVASQQLWLAMLLHALIDLNGLVLRTWILQRRVQAD